MARGQGWERLKTMGVVCLHVRGRKTMEKLETRANWVMVTVMESEKGRMARDELLAVLGDTDWSEDPEKELEFALENLANLTTDRWQATDFVEYVTY